MNCGGKSEAPYIFCFRDAMYKPETKIKLWNGSEQTL